MIVYLKRCLFHCLIFAFSKEKVILGLYGLLGGIYDSDSFPEWIPLCDKVVRCDDGKVIGLGPSFYLESRFFCGREVYNAACLLEDDVDEVNVSEGNGRVWRVVRNDLITA